MNIRSLNIKTIAFGIILASLSACTSSGQSSSLYYTPSLYGYQPGGGYDMDLYMIPRH